MDRNLLITPVGPVERPAKLKARALRTHGGKAPAGGARKSSSLKELAPASATCLTCRACLLTTTAQRRKGNRQKTQGGGSRDKSNNGPQQEKQCNCSSLSDSNDCLVG